MVPSFAASGSGDRVRGLRQGVLDGLWGDFVERAGPGGGSSHCILLAWGLRVPAQKASPGQWAW